MPFSSPYSRFQKSLHIGYDQWHDGIGYDLKAFQQLTSAEKKSVLLSLRANTPTWREIEVFQLDNSPASRQALITAAQSPKPETRLAALRALHELGKLPDFPKFLARELLHVDIYKGLSQALLLVPEHDGPDIRAALLYGVRHRPEVAVHFAAMLYYLAGKAQAPFDMDLRPVFLKFTSGTPAAKRETAWQQLCQVLPVDPATAGKARPRPFTTGQ